MCCIAALCYLWPIWKKTFVSHSCFQLCLNICKTFECKSSTNHVIQSPFFCSGHLNQQEFWSHFQTGILNANLNFQQMKSAVLEHFALWVLPSALDQQEEAHYPRGRDLIIQEAGILIL
jgi:hypothetical protein